MSVYKMAVKFKVGEVHRLVAFTVHVEDENLSDEQTRALRTYAASTLNRIDKNTNGWPQDAVIVPKEVRHG